MRLRLRENALPALFAVAGSALLGWMGLYSYAWTNYEGEAQPSFEALAHGHLVEFLRLAPSYGGSLVERAPFALIPGLWGGGKLAVYRVVAVPCLAATAALGVWLVAQMRSRARGRAGEVDAVPAGAGQNAPDRRARDVRLLNGGFSRAIVLALCVANPISLLALEHGHPEELLGAALCVAAVVLAARGRPVWAGVALGLAVANKEWAAVAAGAVLIALPGRPARADRPPRGRRALALLPAPGALREAMLCTISACLAAGAILAPLVLVPGGGFSSAAGGVASTPSRIFLPWSVWWFLGHTGPHVHTPFWSGGVAGYRAAPPWVGPVSHPAVIISGLVLAGLVAYRRRLMRRRPGPSAPEGGAIAASAAQGAQRADRRAPAGAPPAAGRSRLLEALLLLALALLARSLLDTWDNVYYPAPFLIALLCWEALSARRPPVLNPLATVLMWTSFVWLPVYNYSPDAQAGFFLAWTLPLAGALALELYAPAHARTLRGLLARRRAGTAVRAPSAPWAAS